jgi:hypothetical protein
VITFVAWGALLLAVALFHLPLPYSLVPLLVLAAGLESVYTAHVGVERIGRYIQVRFETSPGAPPDWEHTAMRLQRQPGASTGADPLFSRVFTAATLLNMLPLVLSGASVSLVLSLAVGAFHLIFLLRLTLSRRFAAAQNLRDVELVRGTLGFGDPRPHRGPVG